MKKIIAWLLIIAITAAVTVGGTLAYLTDRDSEANVFTTGDVKIDLEEDFQQGAELLPGVEVEKKPTITNIGENEAYVWATVAIPGGLDEVVTFLNQNTTDWDWTSVAKVEEVEINGAKYTVLTALYNKVLAKDAETSALFTGVSLDKTVDIDPDGQWYTVVNGTAADLEWNNSDGNPVIYVSAYAIQTEGFTSVEDAYEAYQIQWGENGAEWPTPGNLIWNAKEMHASSVKTGEFILGDNIETSGDASTPDETRYGYGYEYIIRKGADYTLNLNGKTIEHKAVNKNANNNALTYLFIANNAGTKLTIDGNGKVYCNNSEGYTCAVQGKDGTLITINGGEYQVDNGIAVWAGAGAHIIINGGSFVNGNATTNHELIYSSGGVIDIYGGFFHNTDGNYTLNVEDRNRATGFINVYGGTFVNFDPSTGGQDPNNIKVAEGYKVISETQANGDIWYTVVKK